MFLSRAVVLYFSRLYRSLWRYTGVSDLILISKISTLNTIIALLIVIILSDFTAQLFSLAVVDYLLTLVLIAGSRFGTRVLRERNRNHGKKTIVIGAGNAGEQIIRDYRRLNQNLHNIVAILDDDFQKIGNTLHGIPIVGPINSLPEVSKKYEADNVLIAIPSASAEEIRKIINLSLEENLSFKTLPTSLHVFDDKVDLSLVRDVDVDDLLGREPVQLDTEKIESYITNKTILITGAGGSIGSELCRQILRFFPKEIILFDSCEFFFIELNWS